MYLDKLKNLVASLDGITSADILPCTQDEIDQLEQEMAVKFPAVYKEFLLWCGRKLGRVVWDDRFYYPFQPSMKEEAIEPFKLYQRGKSINLENVVVILTHEGSSYLFILTNEGDDPPVYLLENDGTVTLYFPHYSDYLYVEAIPYLKWYHGLAEQV